jgi:exopolysaccharide biosynthesis predicted pyruvyltransferase EpsI
MGRTNHRKQYHWLLLGTVAFLVHVMTRRRLQMEPFDMKHSAAETAVSLDPAFGFSLTQAQQQESRGTSPWTSKPPDSIPLNTKGGRPHIRLRHECIRRIRDRHFQRFGPFLLNQNAQQQIREVLLVDPAYHRNVGDHMITLGELVFLQRLQQLFNPNLSVSQCGYIQHGGFVPHCDSYFASTTYKTRQTQQSQHYTNNKIALWHGGGNWGDLWRIAQEYRIPSFAKLLQQNYTIVGMPQSLYYGSAAVRDRDTTILKQGIESALMATTNGTTRITENANSLRVVLTWREHESYEQAKSLYPFVENVLVPDIAFQLGPYQRHETPEGNTILLDILLFLRDDLESKLAAVRNNAAVRFMLSSIEGGERLRFQIVDWADRLAIFRATDYFFTETSVQLLSLGRVVICDRLHAAILCYLSGIPFVYIDQLTGKISKTLKVALEGCADAESTLFARAQSLPEALQLAVGLLKKGS